MKTIKKVSQTGQALVTFLFFAILAITITSAAIVTILVNSLGNTTLQQSSVAYAVAESGVENAILRLLRDPNYTGETLTVGEGTATVQVTNASGFTIKSKGQVGQILRTIQAEAVYANNILTVSSWKEVY